MQKRNNDQPKIVYKGRTKAEIAHLHVLAEISGKTFDEMLEPVVFDESHYRINEKKFERIDNMTHEEYMEYVREQMDK